MSRFARLVVAVSALVLVLVAAPGAVRAAGPAAAAAVLAPSPWDDARLHAWATPYLAGRHDEVLAAVERDLKSSSPHPFAPHVWTVTQSNRGTLDEAIKGLDQDPALKTALGAMPDIFVKYQAGKNRELVAAYPASRAAALRDYWSLVYARYASTDPYDDLEYDEALLRLLPDLRAASNYDRDVRGLDGDPGVLVRARNFVGASPLTGTPPGRYILALSPFYGGNYSEQRAAISEFLRTAPHDGGALAFAAEATEDDLWSHADAAKLYHAAALAYPWFPYFDEEAICLVKAGRRSDADQLFKEFDRRVAPRKSPLDQSINHDIISALLGAGERGEAKKQIDQGLKDRPKDAELQDHLVTYWHAYPDKALEAAREAVTLAPTRARRATLVWALLDADRLDEARTLYQQLTKDGDSSTGAYLHEKLKMNDERVRWHQDDVRDHPHAAGRQQALAIALADAGNKADAVKTMIASYSLQAPYRWTIDKIVEWLGTDAGAIDTFLSEMRKRFPWREDVWTATAARLGGSDAAEHKIALYREAQKQSPGWDWPWRDEIYVLIDAERWGDAAQVAEREQGALASAPVSQRLGALLTSAWVTVSRLGKEQVPANVAADALAKIRQYEEQGGAAVNAAFYRYRLYTALGQKKEACDAAVERSRLMPDDLSNWWRLTQECSQEPGGKDRLAAKRYIDRDPDDPERLSSLARIGVMYWGAPVLTLGYVRHLQGLGSKKNVAEYEGMAMSQLGDSVDDFKARFTHTHLIGASDRYVGWYESSREAAQRASNHVEFSRAKPPEEQFATVTYPTGDVVVRREHPVSGKPTEIKHGNAGMKAKYDASGMLLLELDSGGMLIKFDYDKQEHIKRCAFVVAKQDVNVLTFEYGAEGRPTFIGVRGLELTGSIKVTYDQQGKITDTKSSGGPKIAREVSSSFQRMLNIIRGFESGGKELPRIPLADFKTLEMRFELDKQEHLVTVATADHRLAEEAKALELRMKLIRRLVEMAPSNPDYDSNARAMLADLFERYRRDADHVDLAVTAVDLVHTLVSTMREHGTTADDRAAFNVLEAWLGRASAGMSGVAATHAREVLAKIDRHPIELLPSELWFPQTDYANPDLWTHEPLSHSLPAEIKDARPQAVVVRASGDIVVGTSKGILVRSRGAWRWMGFDAKAGRFAPLVPADRLDATSDIQALAESAGTLWIGTKSGLLGLSADYLDPPTRVASAQGLPADEVTALQPVGKSEIIVGTPRGARRLDGTGAHLIPELPDEAVRGLTLSYGDDEVIVAVTSGLYSFRKQAPAAHDSSLDASAVVFDRLTWGIVNGQLQSAEQSATMSLRDLRSTHPVGLGRVDGMLAVLGDTGAWVRQGSRFERFPVPGVAPGTVFTATATGQERLVLLSGDTVHVHERPAIVDRTARVSDLLTLADLGITLVAWQEGGLTAIDHADPSKEGKPVLHVDSNVRFLARDPGGDVIVAGYGGVSRLEMATGKLTELFPLDETLPHDGSGYDREGKLTSLLAASDGAVWVTKGASLFRWKDGKVEEFSWFKDPVRFPSRSEKISRVVETVDHHIWVVASDESHLSYKGVYLEGGLLEYAGDRFHQLGQPSTQWFLSGYTPIGPSEAIVSSSAGFALHDGTRLGGFNEDFHNRSYMDILDKRNLGLFLGTRGVKVAQDTWLFGTGNGVVSYQRGIDRSRDRWNLLDGLNAILPDAWLADLGGHAVHAIETDPRGNIYVGTDRGLLIFPGGFSSAVALSGADHAFARAAQSQRASESEALGDLASLAPEAKALLDTERRLATLLADRAPGAELRPVGGVAVKPALDIAESTRLDAEITRETKVRDDARTALEKKSPALLELTTNEAPDLDAVRARLAPDEAFVRYLPTPSGLLINVVDHAGVTSREVKVPAAELESRASRAALRLEPTLASDLRSSARGEVAGHDQAPLDTELAWLYAQLIAPIEPLLAGKRQVYVLARGALSDLPFGALVRSRTPTLEYAAEKFAFVYVTSEVLAAAAPSARAPAVASTLVLADVDGNDLTARAEANALAGGTPGHAVVLSGNAATASALRTSTQGAGALVVIASGGLEPEKAARTSILPAESTLALRDLAQLPLTTARLVVLEGWTKNAGHDGSDIGATVRSLSVAGAGWVLFAPGPGTAPDALARVLKDTTTPPALAVVEAQRAAIRDHAPVGRWAGWRVFAGTR
jgi:hypothetical protein